MLKFIKHFVVRFLCLQNAVGAIVIDPVDGAVVASSHDLQHEHPLQHAVMTCIDLVSRSQRGGAWESTGNYLTVNEDFIPFTFQL